MAGTEQLDDGVAAGLREACVQRLVYRSGCRQLARIACWQGEFLACDVQAGALSGLTPCHPRPGMTQQARAMGERPFDFDPRRDRLRYHFARAAVKRDEAA